MVFFSVHSCGVRFKESSVAGLLVLTRFVYRVHDRLISGNQPGRDPSLAQSSTDNGVFARAFAKRRPSRASLRRVGYQGGPLNSTMASGIALSRMYLICRSKNVFGIIVKADDKAGHNFHAVTLNSLY